MASVYVEALAPPVRSAEEKAEENERDKGKDVVEIKHAKEDTRLNVQARSEGSLQSSGRFEELG